MAKIILRQTIDNLGATGDIVDVKAGYARNYLIPRGIALEATEGNVRRLAEEQRHRKQAGAREEELARELAGALEGRSVTFTVRAGEDGRLFGSVTTSDIAEALGKEGVEVDRRSIVLEEPIKQLGVYRISVHLHQEVRPEIEVCVVTQD